MDFLSGMFSNGRFIEAIYFEVVRTFSFEELGVIQLAVSAHRDDSPVSTEKVLRLALLPLMKARCAERELRTRYIPKAQTGLRGRLSISPSAALMAIARFHQTP